MQCHNSYSYGFGRGLTPLIKKLLIIYGAIYVSELIFEQWIGVGIVQYLMIHPFYSDNFHFWQTLTHPFVHSPYNPIGFLIDCLMLYFFASSIESDFGSARFLFFFYFAALGGMICGQLMSGVSGFDAPYLGMMPSILASIVVFGFIHRESTILLFFVLPIKAVYISYGTILVTALLFLAKLDPSGAYHLGGILFGYIYYRKPGLFPDQNLLYLKYLQWQYDRKKKSRFKVFDGQKGKKNDDGPTLH